MAVRPFAAPWLAVLAVGTGAVLVALAVYLRRYWGRSGAEWFVGSLSMHALWCVSYGLGLLVTTPAWRVWLEAISWVGLVWIGYLFLGFALEYTGYNDLRRSWVFPVLGIPLVLTTLCLLVPSLRSLVFTAPAVVQLLGVVGLDYTIQPWGYLILVLGSSYAGLGVILLAETIFSYGSLYRREALAVALSPAVPMVGLVVWMLDIGPASVLNWGVLLTLPHAALDAYAFVGTDMFESSPITRRVRATTSKRHTSTNRRTPTRATTSKSA